MRFTGHERDPHGTRPQTDDLDYMHARYYNPNVARFLSVDPGRDNNPSVPQSWNLLAYVRNNPVNSVDPDGELAFVGVGALVGAALGAGVEIAREISAGESLNSARIGTEAAQGMAVGAVAAATFGTSFLVAGGAVATTTTVTGIAGRALDNDNRTSAIDVTAAATDATSGMVGGAAGARAGQLARAAVANSQAQRLAARTADRAVRVALQGTRSATRQAAALEGSAAVTSRPEAYGRRAAAAARGGAAYVITRAGRWAAEQLAANDDYPLAVCH